MDSSSNTDVCKICATTANTDAHNFGLCPSCRITFDGNALCQKEIVEIAQNAAGKFIKDAIADLERLKEINENVSKKVDIQDRLIQNYQKQLKTGNGERDTLLQKLDLVIHENMLLSNQILRTKNLSAH